MDIRECFSGCRIKAAPPRLSLVYRTNARLSIRKLASLSFSLSSFQFVRSPFDDARPQAAQCPGCLSSRELPPPFYLAKEATVGDRPSLKQFLELGSRTKQQKQQELIGLWRAACRHSQRPTMDRWVPIICDTGHLGLADGIESDRSATHIAQAC
jgi:hypothetical protein